MLVRLLALLLATSCASTTTPPPANQVPVAHASIVEFTIAKDGVALGTLRIAKPGDPGTLDLIGLQPDAAALREAWQREVARGFVGVDMHLPTPEGGMGPYGTRMYRPSSATYVEGVELWLRFQQDLEVTVTRR